MYSRIFASRTARWIRNGLGIVLLLVVLSVAYAQLIRRTSTDKGSDPPQATMAKLPVEPGAVEASFTDGSNLKMALPDAKFTLATAHGRLVFAIADVRCITFATRVAEEDSKRITKAIADLGSDQFEKREVAGTDLLKLREKAYPALLRASQQKDPEVVRRARELLQRIAANVPSHRLEIRKQDVVWTADSIIAGHIEEVALKARTSQFGEVQLKLADVLSLHSQTIEREEALALIAARNAPIHWNKGGTMMSRSRSFDRWTAPDSKK